MIRVSKKIGASEELVRDLERAKKETQFTKAVDVVKQALPGALLINGYNPLTLLHNALSQGLHGESDKECLELATSVRRVLTEFVERMGSALKDDAALEASVNKLVTKTVDGATKQK